MGWHAKIVWISTKVCDDERENSSKQYLTYPLLIIGYADATFLAALEADDTGNGIYIFQESVINPGGHYDNTSGAYTAPYDGVYLFGVHLQASATSGTIGFHVRVDGTNYYANTWQYGEYKSATVIIQLEAGQVVNVNESSGTTIDGEAGLLRSYFFGYLIDAL